MNRIPAEQIPVENVNASSIGLDYLPTLSLAGGIVGRYPVEKFMAVPSVVTVLGMVLGEDFSIRLFKDDSGQLFAQSRVGQVAKVLEAKEACNGWYYKVDRLMAPSKYEYEIRSVPQLDTEIFQAVYVNSQLCLVSLPEAMSSIPKTERWLGAWNSTGMVASLR